MRVIIMKTFALKWNTVPLKKFKIFIKCTREKNSIDNLFLLLQHMGFKKMPLKNFMTGNTAIMNVNKIMNQMGAQITKNKHKRKRNRNYWLTSKIYYEKKKLHFLGKRELMMTNGNTISVKWNWNAIVNCLQKTKD